MIKAFESVMHRRREHLLSNVSRIHCWGEPILVHLKILSKEMKFNK